MEQIDARPILLRTEENAWERSEQIRDQLYENLEEFCRNRRIDALTLKSNPYAHPAWVRFESWMPTDDPTITGRSSMTITINTLPFHKFEQLYKVEWSRFGRSDNINELYALDQGDVDVLLEYLYTMPGEGWRRKPKSVLKARQLRQTKWHLWKPINNVNAVRRDWLKITSICLLLVGVIFTASAWLGSSAEVPWSSSGPSPETVPEAGVPETAQGGDGAVPVDDPLAPAVQDDELVPNVLRRGALELSDVFVEGVYGDAWTLRAETGEAFAISVQGEGIDTRLVVGLLLGEDLQVLAEDDDSGGGYDPRVQFVAPSDATYMVLVFGYDEAQLGRYTIEAERRLP